LGSIDRFVALGELRCELAAFYSPMGRPSIDPELMIRMLIVGYCFGTRSERRLCATSDFATSRAHSTKRATTGLKVLPFSVTAATDHRSTGNSIGSTFTT